MTNCSANSSLAAMIRDDGNQPHYVPPPCQVACPIGTDVASYVGLIWLGDYAGALETITATNPFSGVCGRVCDAPCEPACRRASGDGAVTIRGLKRFVMDKLGADWAPPRVEPRHARSVAIIGSGPAGLTAAQDIAQAGYRVHVYEAASRPGGMMAWGIPDFRLPAEVVELDIRHIQQRYPGIEIHLSTPLGETLTLAELRQRHDAVLLAIGASAGKSLGVPGDDLPGVVDGVTFLARVNGGERPVMPETVLVIGGGDVAMDACRAARRLPGVKKVQVLYRRGPGEIPARHHEIVAALAEGIEIVYNVQPVSVTKGRGPDGAPLLRVVSTSLGDPDADGRRRPLAIKGSERDIPAGLIIAAVGQKAVSVELTRAGVMVADRIGTDAETMRTTLPDVYSAGDAAFGSSTIVNAMAQGHKAAYHIIAQLEGVEAPEPYATPHRTRAVPMAQDPLWEKLAPKDPAFLGLGDDPQAFSDSEAGYDEQAAHEQAARCYRCDIETGSVDYSVKLRETIFEMAKPDASTVKLAEITRKRLTPRDNPFPEGHAATFDELTFLPANLTRLVIDPYREACKTKTLLGGTIELEHPLLIGGFEGLPEELKASVAAGIATSGGGYVGAAPISGNVPWFQVLDRHDSSDPRAAAVIRVTHGELVLPERARPEQRIGLVVSTADLPKAVPFALANKVDILILDATARFSTPWAELTGAPDLSIITEAVRLLRAANAEESIDLIYYGGLRSGSDLAKALSLGCVAGLTEVAVGFAAGGQVDGSTLRFPPLATAQQRTDAVVNFLKAAASEVSMMARCVGKTNVHNLEPEDLRSLTLAAQKATGIVMAGVKKAS
jgi:NADPH-dependent glutamate synthase beta subunit-like oxidoreductase